MSETGLLLAEIQALKRRIQALETVSEHPGFAASDMARKSLTLSQFAATTSAQLAGVLSDEMGSGKAVFNDGAWLKNMLYAIPGEANLDTSMGTAYDRNEIGQGDKRGAITVTLTGAGSAPASKVELVDGSGAFYAITGTGSTTTQIVIKVDLGATVSNYSSANWQPFLQYRLKMGPGFIGTWYKSIVVEVSTDDATYYKPASGAWETADASAQEVAGRPFGLWMGTRASPSIPGNVWRYCRFTLTDRQENSGDASKAIVWIAEIGMRHVSAPFTYNHLGAGGGTLYGDLTMADGKNIAANTTTGTKIGTATGQKLAFHNSTPVIQRVGAAQAAVATTGAVNVTPYGFTTAAQADAIVTLVNELRAALVEKGIIKGAA